jgi:hypothetical protein
MWGEENRRNGEEMLIAAHLDCANSFLEIQIDFVYLNIYLFQTSLLKCKELFYEIWGAQQQCCQRFKSSGMLHHVSW